MSPSIGPIDRFKQLAFAPTIFLGNHDAADSPIDRFKHVALEWNCFAVH